MRNVTTVIFDAFGTLFQDSPQHWDAAMGNIIRQQGLEVSAPDLNRAWLDACEDFRATRSLPTAPFQSYAAAWEDAFAQAFCALNLPGDAAAAVRYWIADMGGRQPYPEIREALTLIAQSRSVVVLSNADDSFLDPALKRLDFPLAASLSSEGAECYKPNPELFHTLLRRLNIPPQAAVYVGDRQYEDVQGAAAAGLEGVWINRTGAPPNPSFKTPDYSITNMLELPALLDG